MAVNLKNITDLPVVESAEGLNLIVNDNGAAKQIAASAVGMQADFDVTDETSPAFIKNKPEIVQADWAETDESSAAFIKNKPFEGFDIDLIATMTKIDNDWNTHWDYNIKHIMSYADIIAKIQTGENPKIRVICDSLSYINERGGDIYPMCEVIDQNC